MTKQNEAIRAAQSAASEAMKQVTWVVTSRDANRSQRRMQPGWHRVSPRWMVVTYQTAPLRQEPPLPRFEWDAASGVVRVAPEPLTRWQLIEKILRDTELQCRPKFQPLLEKWPEYPHIELRQSIGWSGEWADLKPTQPLPDSPCIVRGEE